MRKLTLIFLFVTIYSAPMSFDDFRIGQRGDEYRVWVYLKDKTGSEPIGLSEKTMLRRERNGLGKSLVWLDLSVSNEYVNMLQETGANVLHKSRWLNAVSVLATRSELLKIQALPFVQTLRPIPLYRKENFLGSENNNRSTELPNHLDYGHAQDQIEQINVHLAHEAGYTGAGIRILVMDTGFDLEHVVFDSLNLIDQWDVINNDNETANQTNEEEDNGQDHHGTIILSVIAGYAPGSLIGPAFDAEYLLAKTEMVEQEIQQEEDNYVAGLEWGEQNGADVVSTSLGYLDWYTYDDMDGNTAVTTNAIDIAVGLGMVCVTAAGNEGSDNWYYIIAPADADSVLAVGAVDANGDLAYFSSHGPTSDGRIKPEICARGVSTWACSSYDMTGYNNYNGTSLSTPLVAGAAALIIQSHPEWSAMEVRNAIMMTASQNDEPDNDFGYGILDTWEAIQYGVTVTVRPSLQFPDIIEVANAYPNPFNPEISFTVDAPMGLLIQVSVLDIEGLVVENIYTGRILHSNFKVYWNAAHYPSGLYLLQTRWPGGSHVQKVTFIK
tara:strand:+ start:343 stop:2001 length:1659 start_codon:yes stop_codon:yes gene_type:complete